MTEYVSSHAYAGIPTFWQRYGMTVSSVLGTLMYAVLGYMTDGRIDGTEWMVFAVLTGNTVLIYVVPLFPAGYGWTKNAVNGVLAVLALGYQALVVDEWNAGKILLILWTFGTAVGVIVSPAVSTKTGGVSSGVAGVRTP